LEASLLGEVHHLIKIKNLIAHVRNRKLSILSSTEKAKARRRIDLFTLFFFFDLLPKSLQKQIIKEKRGDS